MPLRNTPSNLGLDIDGVITSNPQFFSLLSSQWRKEGGKVHIVSSRSRRDEVIKATKEELRILGVNYDFLYLLPSIEEAQIHCPESNLDWYQRYLWQKVDYCLKNNVDCFYDDDLKVVELFQTLAPKINVFHVLPDIKDRHC
jgi:hypothetical protein